MSQTEIYGFDQRGNVYFKAGIKNSWRGAMAIWAFLEKKYLPPYIPDYVKATNWYYDGISFDEVVENLGYAPTRVTSPLGKDNPLQEIWDLADNEELSLNEKIVLYTTFDSVLVKKENMSRVIEAFNKFEGVTSLKEQAAVLAEMFEDENCIAVGWNQTSVNSKTWDNCVYDEKTGDWFPYNCLTQDEHFWLFDELD